MRRPGILAITLLSLSMFGGLAFTTASSVFAQAGSAPVTASQTTTFAVENMTCGLCPITVKKAMEQVSGVQSVQIDLATKTATVIFDPSITSLEEIAAASTNAGYPASVKG